ncbi:uncharacterized protein L969DRAFT_42269 [Mixia osmundae IAM 14324]|uniref:ubiquitinyl hydrolase 1 n=1 Tax=Mixia osmundae (strain CBS 9802 / IAM 14324 / JCM 22182 / KY 12970) TaxID=764103 RepID=G7E2U2_MIXOS|nr:uncharacterized protein L969DRAFT_42269 [Mixia osmundae IAM 14324]KEI42424.1 hypothetical protein L969DRAFT_42269 [Mixia osmundae IAM 14324]GAA97286.1 hypothetical protein E5Q_03964 [Mixia osmundae IAM 14324]
MAESTNTGSPAQNDALPQDAAAPKDELTDQEIMALTQQIKEDEAKKSPLVGEIIDLSQLQAEYEGGQSDQIFVAKFRYLSTQGYELLRKLRGDGDCFYRAFAFAWLEEIATQGGTLAAQALSLIELQLPLLEAAGYDSEIVQDFYEPLRTMLEKLATSKSESHEAYLLERFNDAETSNSTVVFLRLIASAFLRSNADEFLAFLFAYEDDARLLDESGMPTMHNFCQLYIEPTQKEVDHLGIVAVTRALRTSLKIADLDRSLVGAQSGDTQTAQVNFHDFDGSNGSEQAMIEFHTNTLLLRPGHYDLIRKT